jgi:hypothetical protein
MPATEVLEQEIMDYKMPVVRLGAPVQWFANGNAVRDSVLGWVTKVGHRGVRIHLCTGVWFDTVRHISDPKLRLSQDQRENGAWDFTEEYQNAEVIRGLQELVKKTDARQVDAMDKLIEEQGLKIKALETKVQELMAQMMELQTKETEPTTATSRRGK